MRSLGVSRTKSEIAISTLSMRLFYYPIIQAIGRSGCAWYEMTYKYNFDPDSGFNFNPERTTDTQFAAQCLMVISTPLISIGYLCIFLIMQPDAMRSFRALIAQVTCNAMYADNSINTTGGSKTNDDGNDRESGVQSPLQLQTHHPSNSQFSEVSHTQSRENSMHSVYSINDAESIVSSRMPSAENVHNVDLFGDWGCVKRTHMYSDHWI